MNATFHTDHKERQHLDDGVANLRPEAAFDVQLLAKPGLKLPEGFLPSRGFSLISMDFPIVPAGCERML